VCVYLFGGNGGNNLIVRDTRYNKYLNAPGNLAFGRRNKLLSPITDAIGNPYSLHYGLVEMKRSGGLGKLAVVLNTGMLEQRLGQGGTFSRIEDAFQLVFPLRPDRAGRDRPAQRAGQRLGRALAG
jgi:hypothetical protein